MKIEILNLFKQLDSCNKTLLVIVLYITAIFHKNLTETGSLIQIKISQAAFRLKILVKVSCLEVF